MIYISGFFPLICFLDLLPCLYGAELLGVVTDYETDFDQNVFRGQDNLLMVPTALNNLLQCQKITLICQISAKKYCELPCLLLMHIRYVHVIPYSVHSKGRLKEIEGTDLVRCSFWHFHYQLSFASADHHLNYLVSSLPDRFLQTITLLSMSME